MKNVSGKNDKSASPATSGMKPVTFGDGHYRSFVFSVINVVCIVCIAVLLSFYGSEYKARLTEQNLTDLSHINSFSANVSVSFLNYMHSELESIALYAEKHMLTVEQTLGFIQDSNSGERYYYQLIADDYSGYQAKRDSSGNFITLDYSNESYGQIKRIFDNASQGSKDISVAPEFTDYNNGFKVFAMYRYITLENSSGESGSYTLLIMSLTRDFIDSINIDAGYEGMSTVLVDGNGNYILSSSDFKGRNFYNYLYVYNDLTLDTMNAIADEIAVNGHGNLFFKDSYGRDCVFSYNKLTQGERYSIICVPVSSFHTPALDMKYTIIVLILLSCLTMFDVAWLNRLNSRLKRSVELERIANNAKSDFLSRMSHDIRTPLNGIIGMTHLAQNELSESSDMNSKEALDFLKSIEVSGDFLLGLVNDILDVSKIHNGKMELSLKPYRYSEFRKYIDAVISPLCAQKGLHFTMSETSTDAPLMLDKLRINQIFFNLLSNSVKFTKSGGDISLESNIKSTGENTVSLDFTLKDNGIGMSEEFQEHMFESFTQENKSGTESHMGTGLGLAIVYNLVTLMGGEIRVESKEGVGTTFYIHINTHIAGTDELSQVKRNIDYGDFFKNKRALVCEDTPISATIICRLLKNKEMLADCAENGMVGLKMFSSEPPGYYDVIIMDMNMPVMNGIDACRAIRALGRTDAKSIPIIAMTANAYSDDIEKTHTAGMNCHLAKPVDVDSMYAAIYSQLYKNNKQ